MQRADIQVDTRGRQGVGQGILPAVFQIPLIAVQGVGGVYRLWFGHANRHAFTLAPATTASSEKCDGHNG
ncbi:hypothetical protein D3C72_2544940 [compost metagenome]